MPEQPSLFQRGWEIGGQSPYSRCCFSHFLTQPLISTQLPLRKKLGWPELWQTAQGRLPAFPTGSLLETPSSSTFLTLFIFSTVIYIENRRQFLKEARQERLLGYQHELFFHVQSAKVCKNHAIFSKDYFRLERDLTAELASALQITDQVRSPESRRVYQVAKPSPMSTALNVCTTPWAITQRRQWSGNRSGAASWRTNKEWVAKGTRNECWTTHSRSQEGRGFKAARPSFPARPGLAADGLSCMGF